MAASGGTGGAGGHSEADVVAGYLRNAMAQHRAGNLDKARQMYGEILIVSPGHADAQHLLGLVSYQTGDVAGAIDLIGKAIKANPRVAAYHANLGQALMSAGRAAEAVGCFVQAIALQPDTIDARLKLGAALTGLARFEEALACYDDLLSLRQDVAAWHVNRAVVLQHLERLDEAASSFVRAAAVDAGSYEALFGLGGVRLAQRQPVDAADVFRRALALRPADGECMLALGTALREAGELDESVTLCRTAVAAMPDNAVAHFGLAVVLGRLERRQEALAECDKAIKLRPDYHEAVLLAAMLLRELHRQPEALELFDIAVTLCPSDVPGHTNRGVALSELGRLVEAIDCFDRALAIEPDNAELLSNRGALRFRLGQHVAAIADCEAAIAVDPLFASAWSTRAAALMNIGRLEEAQASVERAIELAPADPTALANRAATRQRLLEIDEGIADCDRAIASDADHADAHWVKANLLLMKGDLAEGFRLYEWRYRVPSTRILPRSSTASVWTGAKDISGKTLLLHNEQGLGDTIQFCRYARLAADRGARVILEVQKPLLGLLADVDGADEVVVSGEASPAHDYHCSLMSIAAAMRTTLATVPAMPGYLHARKDKTERWAGYLGRRERPRIGLVWSGNVDHLNDFNRSLPLSKLAEALPDGVDYISLQKEIRPADRDELARRPSIRFIGDDIGDFTDTAALCELMDLVVSVDTSVAHLAAALGRETFILLPFSPDWRWLLDRSDSPWYPSVRLFRQPAPSAWQPVLDSLKANLTARFL